MKFMGIELILSPDIASLDRETYDLLSYLGDLGGLVEMLKLLLGVLASQFSALRLKAILINRLYHSDDSLKESVEKI
jgi:hypothetical protein